MKRPELIQYCLSDGQLEIDPEGYLCNYNYALALERENEELNQALTMYTEGYQGACVACEPVALENQRLRACNDLWHAARNELYERLNARDAVIEDLREAMKGLLNSSMGAAATPSWGARQNAHRILEDTKAWEANDG